MYAPDGTDEQQASEEQVAVDGSGTGRGEISKRV
jgi:hypothetical protein